MFFNSDFNRTHNLPNTQSLLYKCGSDIVMIRPEPPGSLAAVWFLTGVGGLAAVAIFRSGPDNFSALLLFLLFLCISFSLMAKWAYIKLDRCEGTLRKKLGFGRSRIYRICEFQDIQIEEKRLNLEGYLLPSYSVRIVGKNKKLELVSTDDLLEARSLQAEIAEFLHFPGKEICAAG